MADNKKRESKRTELAEEKHEKIKVEKDTLIETVLEGVLTSTYGYTYSIMPRANPSDADIKGVTILSNAEELVHSPFPEEGLRIKKDSIIAAKYFEKPTLHSIEKDGKIIGYALHARSIDKRVNRNADISLPIESTVGLKLSNGETFTYDRANPMVKSGLGMIQKNIPFKFKS